MSDLYMIAALALVFAMFCGFLAWCGKVVEGTGGDER